MHVLWGACAALRPALARRWPANVQPVAADQAARFRSLSFFALFALSLSLLSLSFSLSLSNTALQTWLVEYHPPTCHSC